MPKQRNNIVAILDIGGSKVVCFIARILQNEKIEILGVGHNISKGMKAGLIVDAKAIESSIIHAIEVAEKMSGESIQRAYVSISANSAISHLTSCEVSVSGREINQKDLSKLLLQASERFNEQGMDIIHSLPIEYVLDGNRGIENPLGMFGSKLMCSYNIMVSPETTLLNTANSLAKCQLEIDSYIVSSYASGISCLTQDEMELGVTLIEFGASCTSISVFSRGKIVFSDAIPIGGINISNDIALGLCTDFTNAERIKTLYGSVVNSDHTGVIEVPLTSDEESEINTVKKSMLVEIISARLEEMLEILQDKLAYPAPGNKIVITGGAAQLNGLKEMVSKFFGKTVRIGYPKTISGMPDSTSGLAFTSSIGMLLYAIKEINDSGITGFGKSTKSTLMSNVFSWLKQNFA